MRFSKQDLDWAAGEGVITPEDAAGLIAALEARGAGRAKFDAQHVAFYAGALLVVGAMAWFLTAAWEDLGGAGIFIIAAIYTAGFGGFGWRLWNRPQTAVPGGLMVAIVVSITPLAVYGL
jgi:hypothetical protein